MIERLGEGGQQKGQEQEVSSLFAFMAPHRSSLCVHVCLLQALADLLAITQRGFFVFPRCTSPVPALPRPTDCRLLPAPASYIALSSAILVAAPPMPLLLQAG